MKRWWKETQRERDTERESVVSPVADCTPSVAIIAHSQHDSAKGRQTKHTAARIHHCHRSHSLSLSLTHSLSLSLFSSLFLELAKHELTSHPSPSLLAFQVPGSLINAQKDLEIMDVTGTKNASINVIEARAYPWLTTKPPRDRGLGVVHSQKAGGHSGSARQTVENKSKVNGLVVFTMLTNGCGFTLRHTHSLTL